MKTRCKFRCTAASPKTAAGPYSASFEPVYGGSLENERFFAATPGGAISLSVMGTQHFEAGREYYVDFTPAD